MTNNIITFLAVIGYTATVDKVEDNLAHVVFDFENSENLLPCEVSEGDTLHVRTNNGVTEIRCAEPAPTANVDVLINPTTGEIQYVIQDLQIELE